MEDLRERQVHREEAQRQAAMGKRAQAILKGKLGPVLRRWVNASIVPLAALMRETAACYLSGDMRGVADRLGTPGAELGGRERPLRPLMYWLTAGQSLGRGPSKAESTHAEDLALAFMAASLTRLASAGDDRVTLASLLAHCADTLRDTVQGQFISGIQGAKAMQRIRESSPEHWKQRKSLNRICARLHAQVRTQLRDDQAGILTLPVNGHRKILEVKDYNGELRRIELKPPAPEDWEVMSLCWRDEEDGGTPEYRSLWLALAGMFFAAAQRSAGWFEIATNRTGRKGHTRTTRYVVLSEDAHAAIARDVEQWVGNGFWAQPMLVPPEDGDFLTVKHRKVTGQRAPLGLTTSASSTRSWTEGAAALAGSPWTINPYALKLLGERPDLWHAKDGWEVLRVAEHKRLAAEEAFYLPVNMDFRGRIYYRTPFVNPQSDDLGKALLCFPSDSSQRGANWEAQQALIMHMASLYGQGLDKAPWRERYSWWLSTRCCETGEIPEGTEKPLSFGAAMSLIREGKPERVAIQLDGTCNGLQHLTALMRDEEAAPKVNLTASTLEDTPADLYNEVGIKTEIALRRLSSVRVHVQGQTDGWAEEDLTPVWSRTDTGALDPESVMRWLKRLAHGGIVVERSFVKGPVMVIPYGGTRDAVRRAVFEAGYKQVMHSGRQATGWHEALGEDTTYLAFKDRPLKEHPLFHSDMDRLADVIYQEAQRATPKACAFMKTMQEIGKWVGARAIAWCTPQVGSPVSSAAPMQPATGALIGAPAAGDTSPLWVIQAKSKASRKQVTMRGFHLPDMVRRLTLVGNLNEIDPLAHRRGIVANFCHSLDAAHLASAVGMFRSRGGGCVGSVHDCLLVRPSEAALMGACLRETFREIHEADPLSLPVKVGTPGCINKETGLTEIIWLEYPDWYSLAEAAGTAFPEKGTWEPKEVLESAWFFS